MNQNQEENIQLEYEYAKTDKKCCNDAMVVPISRSVKEYEEQMSALRKENFNLKLRLYFLEESVPGYHANTNEGPETVMKQLVDSKIEIASLRGEIQEKQDLLNDAVQVIKRMEKDRTSFEAKTQEIINELKKRIEFLEHDNNCNLEQFSKISNADIESVKNASRVLELEKLLNESEDKLADFQNQINKLDDILSHRDDTIRDYEEKIQNLVSTNAEQMEVIDEKEKRFSNLQNLLVNVNDLNAELKRDNENLVKTLKSANEHFSKEVMDIKTCEKQMQEQQDALRKMQHQQSPLELEKLQSDLADKICSLKEAEEKLKNRSLIHEQACRTIQKLMFNIKNQEEEISRLKNSKRPQENSLSINKEVCRTNYSNNNSEFVLSKKELFDESNGEKQKLEEMVKKQAEKIIHLENKIMKIYTNAQNMDNKGLREKNEQNIQNIDILNKLSCENDHNQLLQNNSGISAQSREIETNNDVIISHLQNELEIALEKIEDAEKWRRECGNVCKVLSDRLEELAGFLNSLLKHKDILGMIETDKRCAMRQAVDESLNLSKSLNETLLISYVSIAEYSSSQLNLTDLFCDIMNMENTTFQSQKDLITKQSVDKLQINKIDNENTKFKSNKDHINKQSLEILDAEKKPLKIELEKRYKQQKNNRRSLPLQLENPRESTTWSKPRRVLSCERILLENAREPLLKEQQTHSESETREQVCTCKPQYLDRVIELEEIVVQRENHIQVLEGQLFDADRNIKKEHLCSLNIDFELKEMVKQNTKLTKTLVEIETQNKIIAEQMMQMASDLKISKEENEHLTTDIQQTEKKVSSLEMEIDEMKQKHEKAISNAVEVEKQKFNQLKSSYENKIQERLLEQENIYKRTLEAEWISRHVYEELKKQYHEAERSIEELNENENILLKIINENNISTCSLKKQMNESNLQDSKTVLEGSKAFNYKSQFEKTTEQLTQQISIHEHDRSALQDKMKNVESNNDKLQKSVNVIKNTNGDVEVRWGYTSRDSLNNSEEANNFENVHVNNLSPDLGIKCHAECTSNAELSDLQLVMEKNVSDFDRRDPEADVQPADDAHLYDKNRLKSVLHDCNKVEHENAELRRKLIRTKRAFEKAYEKLRIANHKKAQIENDIKNQIFKTHNVLKNVRSNMEHDL